MAERALGEKTCWSRNALETPRVPSDKGRDWSNCKRMLKAELPHIKYGGSSSHDFVFCQWPSIVGAAHRRQGCGMLASGQALQTCPSVDHLYISTLHQYLRQK